MDNTKNIALLNKVIDFINNYSDDEAVDLISEIYMMLLEVSSSASILMIENKLLNRELEHIYEEEDLKELNDKLDKKGKMVS